MSITNPFPTIYSQIQFFMALFCTSSCHFNVISFYALVTFFFLLLILQFFLLIWVIVSTVCWCRLLVYPISMGLFGWNPEALKMLPFFRSFESCKMHSIHFKNHFHDKLSFEHILTWFGFGGAFTDCSFAHTVHCCHFQKIVAIFCNPKLICASNKTKSD